MWSFIFRFIELLFVFFVVRSAISTVSRLFGGANRAAQHVPPVQQSPSELRSAGVFKKDPVCQTYILVPSEWVKRIGEDTVYFCSKECRDRFRV